jgi:hypothetical protein
MILNSKRNLTSEIRILNLILLRQFAPSGSGGRDPLLNYQSNYSFPPDEKSESTNSSRTQPPALKPQKKSRIVFCGVPTKFCLLYNFLKKVFGKARLYFLPFHLNSKNQIKVPSASSIQSICRFAKNKSTRQFIVIQKNIR